MKKGLSYIDISISAGIFILYLLFVFVTLRPGIKEDISGGYLLQRSVCSACRPDRIPNCCRFIFRWLICRPSVAFLKMSVDALVCFCAVHGVMYTNTLVTAKDGLTGLFPKKPFSVHIKPPLFYTTLVHIIILRCPRANNLYLKLF